MKKAPAVRVPRTWPGLWGPSGPAAGTGPLRLVLDKARQRLRSVRLPSVALQQRASECGYVCISAALALRGVRLSSEQVIGLVGETNRGLTLRQLRDGLRACGLSADAIAFAPGQPAALPPCAVVLLKGGHFVLARTRRDRKVDVFDPQQGWSRIGAVAFMKAAAGTAVGIGDLDHQALAARTAARGVDSRIDRPDLLRRISAVAYSGPGAKSCLAAAAAAAALLMALPLLSKWIVDDVAGVSAGGYLSAAGLVFVLVAALGTVLEAASRHVSLQLSRRLATRLVGKIHDNLATKPAAWFETRPAQMLGYRIGLIDALRDYYVELPLHTARVCITLTVGLVALFFVSPLLLLPGLIALALSSAIDWHFNAASRHHAFAEAKARNNLQRFLIDLSPLIPMLTRLGGTRRAKQVFRSHARQAATAGLQLGTLQARQAALQAALKLAEQVAFASTAAYFIEQQSHSLGVFVALGAYKDNLANALGRIFNLWQQHASFEPYRVEVAELLTASPARRAGTAGAVRGAVLVTDLHFRYGELDVPVLCGIDERIEAGSVVAVRGASGAGKSTLLKLVGGLLAPSRGRVEIDGIAATRIGAGVSYVAQGGNLLAASLRENIALFRTDVDDRDIYAALQAVELDQFVRALPMRLDTRVGDDVGGLSGGQRQRVLLARALVGRPALLVLDEATANLDVELEARILGRMRDWATTVVMSAHRPEVWAKADRVMTLDSGTQPRIDTHHD